MTAYGIGICIIYGLKLFEMSLVVSLRKLVLIEGRGPRGLTVKCTICQSQYQGGIIIVIIASQYFSLLR